MEVEVTKSTKFLNYGALTIDTNVFYTYGYKFKNGILSQLAKFKDSDMKVIQSDIVHKECLSHIHDYYATQERAVNSAIQKIQKYSEQESQDIDRRLNRLISSIDPKSKTEEKLNSFYESVGAKVIKSEDYIQINKIIDMYFSFAPPFEENEKKRYEFPDAIALKTLEAWADENDTKVLAISNDKGWIRYAEKSRRIDVIEDLKDALSRLIPQQEALKLVSIIKDKGLINEEEVEDFFVDDLNGTDLSYLTMDYSSSFMFDIDDMSAELTNCSLDRDDNGKLKIVVLNVEDRKISAVVMADINATIRFGVDFQTLDPVDKDVFSISYESFSVDTNYYAEALIDIHLPDEGDELTTDNVDIEVVDVTNHLDYIYLGELEPSFTQ